ncbi:hypothetical protein KSP35_09575 [Aquihabitans sp. G128]|uniref:SCO7613 C-terminal domain-containing membrane protein n=1 Tax=Aquihabitans sp. G128 TaxID=2849779 RepID=UPI001C230E5C|nr:hypothetical protein [Aquihabitans sp. G128]QXC63003.1 hypothetical protein KSP35_09575 [Aquihabitans sp. G128]
MVAALVARRWWDERGPADVAAGTATLLGLVAVGRVAFGAVPDAAWWPLLGLVSAGVLAAAPRLLAGRAEPVRAVAWCAAGVASLPVLDAVRAAVVAAFPVDGAWHGAAADHGRIDRWGLTAPAVPAVVAGALALAAAVVASLLPGAAAVRDAAIRRRLGALGLGLAALLAVTLPALADAPVVVMVICCLGVAAALAGAVRATGERVALPAASFAVLALGGAWSSATAPLTLVALAAAVLIGGAAVLDAVQTGRDGLAGPGAALVALGLVAEAGLGPFALGAAPAWAWTSVATVAAALGAVLAVAVPIDLFARSAPAPVLDPTLPAPPAASPAGWAPAGVAAAVAGTIVAAAHGFGLLTAGTVGGGVDHTAPLTVALVVGAACLVVVGLTRRGRGPAWSGWLLAGGGELVALAWLRLAEGGVVLVEAYTGPLALLVAAAVVLVARKGPGWPARTPSWQLEGPVLALGLLPTVFLSLGDPGLTRQAIGLAVGAVLLGFGVAARRRAPVDVGAVAVALIGLQALAPYAAEVPRWISLGLAGTLLVVLGATFEQRRRDLHEARRHYAALR